MLGHDRLLPRSTQEGDVLLIANAGAYGHAMSSRYNLREPAEEICICERAAPLMARRLTKRQRLALRIALAVLAVVVVAAIIYFVHLDRIVTRQFEGRRWTLPAQVYAAPLELYAGLPLAAGDIEKELQRLQYRKAGSLVKPGEYHRQGARVDVALRAARFADEIRGSRRS